MSRSFSLSAHQLETRGLRHSRHHRRVDDPVPSQRRVLLLARLRVEAAQRVAHVCRDAVAAGQEPRGREEQRLLSLEVAQRAARCRRPNAAPRTAEAGGQHAARPLLIVHHVRGGEGRLHQQQRPRGDVRARHVAAPLAARDVAQGNRPQVRRVGAAGGEGRGLGSGREAGDGRGARGVRLSFLGGPGIYRFKGTLNKARLMLCVCKY